jgi:hypothetical protein
MSKRFNYRKLAFEAYDPICPICAHCGFGIPAVLEVAHIDCDRSNNEISNLVILCPNCHKMHDLDIISTETIIEMRDRPKVVDWKKRMKDAGQKAALTRKRSTAAKKAAATRRRNLATDEEKGAASTRFESDFGELQLDNSMSFDNESIDADLAREYANIHEEE